MSSRKPFESARELMEALLAGKKICNKGWSNRYLTLHSDTGDIADDKEAPCRLDLFHYRDYTIYKSPPLTFREKCRCRDCGADYALIYVSTDDMSNTFILCKGCLEERERERENDREQEQ